ncbi:hypothetical protein GCM10011384_44880 [Psychrobacillus lasiicapitis]|nr:hypothetical protein GCM10011384_44880 [Psychrobacillus lasiicapitis]
MLFKNTSFITLTSFFIKKAVYCSISIRDENSSLIKHLFAKVPSGSSKVLDYANETLYEEKSMSNRVENIVKMTSASGESIKSRFTNNGIQSMLEESGLLIYESLTSNAIHGLFFSCRSDYLCAFETVHFIHAVKR